MSNFFYIIFIYPVYMFVEFIFFIANNITEDHTGISIVILSFVVNLICLPIYNVAENWQERERAIQNKMKPKIKDIKNVFKGDERYMILSTYYRQNSYHPVYALRGVFALLIQIPFFIAAYKLLSGLPAMNNSPFCVLHNLGKPDGLLSVGNMQINVLPIIMTVINIAASIVYTKGLGIKEKLQLHISAFLFLILLYNSPSGLVLYWTLNNIFSLFKNIFYKVRLERKTWYIVAVLLSISLMIITFLFATRRKPIFIVVAFTFLILLIPIIRKFTCLLKQKIGNKSVIDNDRVRLFLFSLTLSALMLFIGLVIPSTTIASSPMEFMNFENIKHPVEILYHSFLQVLGCFFWFFCIYKLFSKDIQKKIVFISILMFVFALINAFIFQGNYGDINNLLVFEDSGLLHHSLKYFVLNISVLLFGGIIVVIVLSCNVLSKYLYSVLGIVIFSFLALTGFSLVRIHTEYRRGMNSISLKENSNSESSKSYKISRNGQNIVFLMLDRSMNFFIDPIFENSSAVRKEYTGFKLFENTIAFGIGTITSTPSLYGGYEYTPENIDKRSNELMVDKHNEALNVLPKLFNKNGWSVSFTDPSWANYSWIPDTSVFDESIVTAKNIDTVAKYTNDFMQSLNLSRKSKISGIRRNMLYFSIFRILPVEVRRVFYASGKYAGTEMPLYSAAFIDAYSALENIETETEFIDDGNCLNIIVNNTTHKPPKDLTMSMLNKGDLISLAKKYCLNQYTAEHFYANYLAHESCAKFFRLLKENNCWNNTRIIIAGDHGRYSMNTVNMSFLDNFVGTGFEPEKSIPLLMMKDFNSDGALQKDSSFMTLADVPILITEGLSSELQINPFTGVEFNKMQNKNCVKIMIGGDVSDKKTATQFSSTAEDWGYVKENVYDSACWSKTDSIEKEGKR